MSVRSITPNDPANFTPTLGDYKELKPFRFWCQKVLPLVYDDSLSYYELLCKVVDFLNKTMEDVETLEGDVTNLHTAYKQLQDYVNNYFSTLDVQEEINNKLDEMAKDGSLTNLIKAYLDPLINEQNNKITVLENRMNTFASLPEGSTTGDAELADIRVPAIQFNNGESYPSAGDSVRGQTGTLANRVLTNINIIKQSILIDGKYFDAEEHDYASYSYFKGKNKVLANTVYKLNFIARYISLFKKTGEVYEIKEESSEFIPKENGYVYISFNNNVYDGNELKCVLSSENFNDATPYNTEKTNLLFSNNITNNAFNGILQDFYNDFTYTKGYIEKDGTITETELYLTSDFIKIERDRKYAISPYIRKLLYFDLNKNAIQDSFVDADIYNYTFNTSNSGYVRFSTKAIYSKETAFCDITEIYSDKKLPENIHASLTVTNDILKKAKETNTLNNKIWCHCGDSFSNSTNAIFEDGLFNKKGKTFPRLIAEKNNMQLLENFFLDGRTMAYPSDNTFVNSLTAPNVSYNYKNIPSNADYITIMLGINDVNHINGIGTTPDGEDATGVITLGDIDSTDISTYYGAYNTVLNWIRNNRPFAHVGIFITNGTEDHPEYTEAQIKIAEKWGYPYINLNGDNRTPAFIRTSNAKIGQELRTILKEKQAWDYAGGNTHPNYETHELESTIIENFLLTL